MQIYHFIVFNILIAAPDRINKVYLSKEKISNYSEKPAEGG